MISENGGSPLYMPVAPAYGMGGGNGNGMFGDQNGWWIILLFLVFGGRGFGYGGGGNGGGTGFFPYGYSDVQRGFDQNAVMTGINGLQNTVTSGFGDVQNALCNGFAGVANGFAQSEISNNARQIANMQQDFAMQTAMSQGFNNLGTQFANCCCENRLGLANLNSTILSENCADRATISDGIRDILTATQNNTQRIIDQLCADKIDAKNEKIADLQRQLTMADLRASQGAQTAQIIANNEAQTVALERYLAPTPIPAYTVANPNCCQQNFGCGCNGF